MKDTDACMDIARAYPHKSDKDLRVSLCLFRLINIRFLAVPFIKMSPFLIHFPLVRSIIKATVFKQFMGGVNVQEAERVIHRLARYKVQVILDYASEAKEKEADFEQAVRVFKDTLAFAHTQPSVPFITVKLSALGTSSFFTSFNELLTTDAILRSALPAEKMSPSLRTDYEKVLSRLERIISEAAALNQPVMIDAEESWVQQSIDFITHLLVKKYNKEKALLYHTFQMYRQDKWGELQQYVAQAKVEGFHLGVKLVRGAYMEKENLYAQKKGIPSLMHASKTATDTDYDKAVSFCLNTRIAIVIATHNRHSVEVARRQIEGKNFSEVYFSQLYGMGDILSFPLADDGFAVCKYLPFGTVKEAIPYLVRRAQENASFLGQSAQEYSFLKQEMNRRKTLKNT